MPLPTGARLGPYGIVGLIGAGGMGEVYRSRDTRLGRDVAVKVLPAELVGDPNRLKRFEQEARAAAALNHPNLIALYDIGSDQGTSFIVTELLDGDTLRQLLLDQRLPVARIVNLAAQIAEGLAAAHARGIVHRDIKPENIFVTEAGRVKILDFGLAKSVAMSGDQHALDATTQSGTEPHMILGTVGYMAPEQVRGQPIDHRADVFAFGVVLYEMLAGRRAFAGDTALDTMTSILRETPAPLASTADRPLPPALVRIVERCLEKAPGARFQSTTDLAFALKSLSTAEPTTVSGSAMTAPVTSPRSALTGWIVAAGLLLAVVMLLWHPWGRSVAIAPAAVVRLAIAAPDGLEFALTTANVAPFPAVSPDGQQLVFSAAPPGGPVSLWLQSLKSDDARLLAGTSGTLAYMAFWSPDSHSIGFFTENKLKRIDVNSGAVQTLCEAPHPNGGTWSTDGSVVFASEDPTGGRSSLKRIPASGGTPVLLNLSTATNGDGPRQPSFLPDGRHFLYQSAADHWIWVGSLSGEAPTRLLQADSRALYVPPGYILFGRQTRLFAQRFDANRMELGGNATLLAEDVRMTEGNGRAAFSASSNGVLVYRTGDLNGEHTLAWFDRAAGQMLGSVKDSTARYNNIWLLPDGRSIVAQIYDPAENGSNMWRIDLESGARTRLTSDPGDNNLILSPDGASIAWTAGRTTASTILRRPADGSGREEPWVTNDAPIEPTDWSAHWVVFNRRNASSNTDIWVTPVDDPAKPRLYLAGASQGRLSPDEKWMAYQSDETGHHGVYVRPFPDAGGGKSLVSGNVTGNWPLWTDGGRELFFVAPDVATLMSVAVSTAGHTLTIGQPRVVLQRVGLGGRRLALTRDGRRVLVSIPPASSGTNVPLTVIVNWPELMAGR